MSPPDTAYPLFPATIAGPFGGLTERGADLLSHPLESIADRLTPVRLMAAKLAEAERIITQQRERIEALETLAMTDELTGLTNRRGFMAMLRRELAAAQRGAGGGVMVMIDLDGFKQINDIHGHLAGDAYLRQVAKTLIDNIRTQDLVARLGGDEFAVLLTRVDANTGLMRAKALAEAMNMAAMNWHGTQLPLRASFGVQPYGDGDREDAIIRAADVAMYRVKGNSKRQARVG